MKNNHDPYLITVQRSLKAERIKTRKEQLMLKKKNQTKGGFFSQTFELQNFIDLPRGLREVVLLGLFLLIPYLIGLSAIIISQTYINGFQGTIQEFLLFWMIGYELSACLLFLTIIKQAFTYKDVDSGLY